MSTNNTRARLIVASVTTLVILSVYVLFFLYIQNKSETATLIQQEVAIIQEQNEQFSNLSDTVRNIDEDREKLSGYFVQPNAIVDFLEIIESFGKDTGAEVEVKTIEPLEGEGDQVEFLLSVTAAGSWSQVYHFMVLLESIPVRLVLDQARVRIARDSEPTGTDTPTLNADSDWLGAYSFRVLGHKE